MTTAVCYILGYQSAKVHVYIITWKFYYTIYHYNQSYFCPTTSSLWNL